MFDFLARWRWSRRLPKTPVPDIPSTLHFAVPKSGVVLSTNIVRSLANRMRIPYVRFNQLSGYNETLQFSPGSQHLFRARGYCYGEMTLYPQVRLSLGDYQSILVVRDPRDAIVSMYYSMKSSHPEPPGKATAARMNQERARLATVSIDEFALGTGVEFIRECLGSFIPMTSIPTLKTFRYEDVIYRKREWIEEICSHFRWPVPTAFCDLVARENDIFPKIDNPHSHIRHVHPGNHRVQLKTETIRRLEHELEREMAAFGYQPDVATWKSAAS